MKATFLDAVTESRSDHGVLPSIFSVPFGSERLSLASVGDQQNGMPFSTISALRGLGRPLGGGGPARSRQRPVVDMFTESNMETRMAVFRIDLLFRLDEHREQRHDLYAPDIAAAVVQAKALFRALSPGRPSLVGFRIMENGLIAYEASKGDLAEPDGGERTVQPTATMRARLVCEPDR